MAKLVEINNLKFRWPSGGDLLNIQSFKMDQGEKVFLYGPSGSGKSTFLNLISGVLQAQSGEIRILNNDIGKMTSAQRDQFRGDHMGFIFQIFNLLPYFSSYENITLPMSFSKLKRSKFHTDQSLKEEVLRLLDGLRLDQNIINKKVTELSVGQQQRVAVARALIGSPELIIADEPTSALDSDARKSFLDLLFAECNKNGLGLIFVSHDLELGSTFDRTISLASLNRSAESSGV